MTPAASTLAPARERAERALSPQPHLGQHGQEVQPFGTLRLVPIALSAQARAESVQLVNGILADTTIIYALYKKHHWLVSGPTFYQLHLLFDKHAGEQLELVDLLAERVQSLGGIAVGDPRHAAELTRIERPPDGAEEVPVMLSRLLEAHETVITALREAIEATARNGDWGSNDLLMSDVLRRHELQVWFLSQHLIDVPLVDA
jgi:starvation-inducible DNA-binding protein